MPIFWFNVFQVEIWEHTANVCPVIHHKFGSNLKLNAKEYFVVLQKHVINLCNPCFSAAEFYLLVDKVFYGNYWRKKGHNSVNL